MRQMKFEIFEHTVQLRVVNSVEVQCWIGFRVWRNFTVLRVVMLGEASLTGKSTIAFWVGAGEVEHGAQQRDVEVQSVLTEGTNKVGFWGKSTNIGETSGAPGTTNKLLTWLPKKTTPFQNNNSRRNSLPSS